MRLPLVVLALCLVSAGCARTVNRTAERKVRDVLPTYIGPAASWRAHIDSAPMSTVGGRLSRLVIDGEGVHLRQTIVCDRLHIEMRDLVVDTGRQRLRSVGQTTFVVTIGEAALNRYLLQPGLPDGDDTRLRRVVLQSGALRIEGTRRLLGREWPFTVTVEPRLASPTRLEFDPDRMTVLGLRVPLPAAVLRWFGRRLSDGFDLSTLPFPVRVEHFSVAPGAVSLEGSADVLQSLQAEMQAPR